MNYWMIAAIVLALTVLIGGGAWLRSRKACRVERERLSQESDGLRAENIDLRREIAALERDLEAEQKHSDGLCIEIEQRDDQLCQAEERIHRAEARRTDAEKEMFAARMRLDQLQQQLHQSHTEQINQERLYQDIIQDRDQTISDLQEKLYRRKRKKKHSEALEQQITLDDILGGGNL